MQDTGAESSSGKAQTHAQTLSLSGYKKAP